MSSPPGPDEAYCRHCGEIVKERAEVCPGCGVRKGTRAVARSTTYCSACGEELRAEAELCPNCGVRHARGSGGSSASGVDVGYVVTSGLGVLFVLAGIGGISELRDPLSVVGGVAYLAIGLLFLPQVRERLERSHPITTFGHVETTDATAVRDADAPCVICQGAIDEGVRREYARDLVAFGVSVSRSESGENAYCRECLDREEPAVATAGTRVR